MALPATDSFTTGTSQTLTSYSSNWTNLNGTYWVDATNDNVRGGTVSAENIAYWNADSFNNDQYSKGVLDAFDGTTNFIGVTVRVRLSGGRYYYGWYVSSEEAFLNKQINSSYTDIAIDSTSSFNVGDTIELRIVGTTLTPYRNGSVYTDIGAQTQSDNSSGSAGLNAYANGGAYLDDWEGGNLGDTTINKTETVNVGETVTVKIQDNLSINITQSVGVSDTPTVSRQDATTLTISKTETINLGDVVTITPMVLGINKTETINLGETRTLNPLVLAVEADDDIITVTDTRTINPLLLAVDTNQGVGVGDTPTVFVEEEPGIPPLGISITPETVWAVGVRIYP